MSQETNKTKAKHFKEDHIQMPDFTELWKELYFKNESDWSRAFKNFISSEVFVSFLNQTLEQYLAFNKVNKQQIDRYSEYSPVPSKKDVARVAELLISLEEKVDLMEFQLLDYFKNLTEGVMKMVDFQDKFSQELIAIKGDLETINKKIEQINKKSSTTAKSSKSSKKPASPKKTSTTKEDL